MILREAESGDWEILLCFFQEIYRKDHPLHNREFWEWQYGDRLYGRSFISVNNDGKVVGHVGANFQGGLAWIINVYLKEEYRGNGILGDLYKMARLYFPLAATAANQAGLGLYRNMKWIRYHDLQRYVLINPKVTSKDLNVVCQKVNVDISKLVVNDTHYFKQPSLRGILLEDGSRAVSQENVGGLRIVSVVNLQFLQSKAWNLGYLWMDYITSWNDPTIKQLEIAKWELDYNSVIPWHLDPLEKGYFCDVTFLSEETLEKDFIVSRNFSDHGRVGSLNK